MNLRFISEISNQVLIVLAFDSNEQRLYGLSRNGKNILKSKDSNGAKWRGTPKKEWFSVRDRASVYTAVEIPFVPISRNITDVIEPLVQLSAYNGDKWQGKERSPFSYAELLGFVPPRRDSGNSRFLLDTDWSKRSRMREF
jgi:hypothetical protein